MSEKSWLGVDDSAAKQYEASIKLFNQPLVDALVKSAVGFGDAVLDVACGTGIAARSASRAVGESGRVVGTDVNPEMVALAQTVPNEGGCVISWQAASGLDLPFEDGEFDAVVCSQGVQFFADTGAGLAEMARVTRAGGRLAISVWTPRQESPFLDAQFNMLAEFAGLDLSLLNTAHAVDAAQVRDWFVDAGLNQVEVTSIESVASLPPVREYSPQHLSAMPRPWTDPFFELDDSTREKAMAFVEDWLADYTTPTGLVAPFRTFLAKATI
jgi:ubiquinone/menaquinone biosynthesis C-methylase UbiE